jgi:hypothetical protein
VFKTKGIPSYQRMSKWFWTVSRYLLRISGFRELREAF